MSCVDPVRLGHGPRSTPPYDDSVPDQSPIGAVDKALQVLQALGSAGPRGLTLTELSSQVEQNKATIHRTLAALRFRGFAEQDQTTGLYTLGATSLQLANDYLQDSNLPELLHPALLTLCARTNELVHLGVLSGAEVVYLDKVEPTRALRVWSAVGSRMPAATTALGRALIAYTSHSRDAVPWFLSAVPSPAEDAEERTWQAVRATRARGYSVEEQENEPGISCVGVPLLQAGRAVAAVSVTAPFERMGSARIPEIVRLITETLPSQLPPTLSLPEELVG